MRTIRRTLSIAPLVLAALGLVSCAKLQDDKVRTRVLNVFNGIKEDGGGVGDKINFAMLSWDDGNRKVDGLNQEAVYDRFARFCQEKDVNRRISSFEIGEIRIVPDSNPLSAMVSLTIEGRPHRLRVVEHQRMQWAD